MHRARTQSSPGDAGLNFGEVQAVEIGAETKISGIERHSRTWFAGSIFECCKCLHEIEIALRQGMIWKMP